MKFSHCGRLLATAGQDNVVRIWVLKTAFDYFNNMRIKYNTEGALTCSYTTQQLLLEGHALCLYSIQVEFHLLPLRKVCAPLNLTLILG